MKMFWPMQVCALLCSAHFARYNAVEVMQSKSTMVFSVMASKLGNPFPRDRWGKEVTQQEVTTLFFASSGIPSVTPPIRPALLIWMFPSHTDTHTERHPCWLLVDLLPAWCFVGCFHSGISVLVLILDMFLIVCCKQTFGVAKRTSKGQLRVCWVIAWGWLHL